MKTIIVNKSDRDNVSINFANNKNIFITFRNKIYNELKINSTFDLINAHKFTDKYNIFEGCKVIDISFIENTTRIKCDYNLDLNSEIHFNNFNLNKYIRTEKIKKINENT